MNEINEDNCVLSGDEIACIEVTFEEKFITHGELFVEELDKIFQKINKLNEMAKELHARNLSVETIVKYHEIGKQAMEKEK